MRSPCGQSLLQAFEDGIDGRFCLGSGQARPLNYVMYDVLLDQGGTSLHRFRTAVEHLTLVMLQVLRRLGN